MFNLLARSPVEVPQIKIQKVRTFLDFIKSRMLSRVGDPKMEEERGSFGKFREQFCN